MKLTTIFLSVFLLTATVHAKVLQEGWYKLLSGNQHVGYSVQKYSFDDAKKEFKVTNFTKTNSLGGDFTESLTATCTTGFEPLTYQYTMTIGKKPKLIDAVFKNGSMTAKVTEEGQTKTIQDKIDKGTFLSSFLVYMILNNKSGLKIGNSFEYNAIAEEDAKPYKGFADVNSTEKSNGHETFKILVKYKDVQSVNHVTPIGEMYDVKQPASSLQLVAAKKEDATKGFTSSDKLLKNLFGSLPKDSPLTVAAAETKVDTKPVATEKATQLPAKAAGEKPAQTE